MAKPKKEINLANVALTFPGVVENIQWQRRSAVDTGLLTFPCGSTVEMYTDRNDGDGHRVVTHVISDMLEKRTTIVSDLVAVDQNKSRRVAIVRSPYVENDDLYGISTSLLIRFCTLKSRA